MKTYSQNTNRTARSQTLPSLLLYLSRTLFLIVLLFALYFQGASQLCSGSLGDPIVNITFGAGANPGPVLSAIGTGYTYMAVDCPNDGQYAIRNSTSACFGSTWHTLTRDHTGDPQGYFMLVNASYQPNDFYVDTVRNLCANTTYEFAAWIMNVQNVTRNGSVILPNITFQVEKPDGTVLKTVNTGDLPVTTSPQWKQYGFWFSTPPGLQKVVLRITNNAPGGIGNDIALDDITFRPCGPEVKASIVGSSDKLDMCEDALRPVTLEVEAVAGYATPSYQWQLSRDSGRTWNDIPGATNLSYDVSPTEVGSYQYRLTVAEMENAALKPCRVSSNKLEVGVHALPAVDAGPDRKIIKGITTSLLGTAHGEGLSYSWSPSLYLSDANSLNPEVSAPADILYTLTAESAFGCSSQDVVKIQVANDLYIPNAFTPNGDGINDTWQIPFLDAYPRAEVTVYSRYGQVVYHSLGGIVSWDGTWQKNQLPIGTYVYLIQVKKQSKTLRGTVTILR